MELEAEEVLISDNVALSSIDTILCWLEQQSDTTYDMKPFSRLRCDINHQQLLSRSRQKQMTLDRWAR
jgi:hypothetical protein